MNRRLYFVLPDVPSAETTMDDLLLARVDARRIHCLARFNADIDSGRILMMVDVPFTRSKEVTDLVVRRHPEAMSGGMEPSIPAFP